jgi:hypothetical protein
MSVHHPAHHNSLSRLFTDGQQQIRPPEGAQTVTISFTGDIAFIHGVAERLRRGEAIIAEEVASLLAADVVIGNLETPLVAQAALDPHRGALFSDEQHVEHLLHLGITACSLANNHTMDCGEAGLLETLAALQRSNLRAFGAGANLAAARRPLLVEHHGINIGVLAYSQSELDAAEPDTAGVAPLRRQYVLEDLQYWRSRVDLLLLIVHEGYEFHDYPRLEFLQFCREVIETGADAVIAHHPHVPQGMEMHRGRPILYSLGNFLFDIPYHREHRWTRIGLAPRLTFDRQGLTQLEIHPVCLTPEHWLRPLDGDDMRECYDHLRALSAALEDEYEIERRQAEFVREVIKVVLGAPYQYGHEDDARAFEAFCTRQIYRDPYLKVFSDFARLVGKYPGLLAQSSGEYDG